MSKTNYIERIAKGSLWVFVITILATLIAYLLRIFLARELGPAEFGLFYAVLALLTFFSLFKDLGIGSALAKFIPEFRVKRKISEIKSSILFSVAIQYISGVFVFLFLFFSSETIANTIFGTIDAQPIIQILALELLLSITIVRYIVQGFQKMKTFASIELTRIAIILLLVLFFTYILPPLTLTDIATSYLASALFVLIFFGLYVLKFSGKVFKAKTNVTGELAKKLMKFGFAVLIASTAATVLTYTDTLTITIFRTLDEVGLYQVAVPTSNILWIFIASMSAILLPVFSEIWAKKKKALLSETVGILIKFSFIFMIPLALIMISFPELIINTVFGEEYILASPALQILSVAALAYTMMMISSILINAIGKPNKNIKVMLMVAIFNLIANIILVPIFGIIGAATTTFLSYLLGFLLLSSYVKKYINLKVAWSSLAKAFFIGIISLLIVFGLKEILIIENPIIEAVICLAFATAFYGIAILQTKIITKEDILIIKDMNLYIPEWVKRYVMKFMRD